MTRCEWCYANSPTTACIAVRELLAKVYRSDLEDENMLAITQPLVHHHRRDTSSLDGVYVAERELLRFTKALRAAKRRAAKTHLKIEFLQSRIFEERNAYAFGVLVSGYTGSEFLSVFFGRHWGECKHGQIDNGCCGTEGNEGDLILGPVIEELDTLLSLRGTAVASELASALAAGAIAGNAGRGRQADDGGFFVSLIPDTGYENLRRWILGIRIGDADCPVAHRTHKWIKRWLDSQHDPRDAADAEGTCP